VKTRSHPAAAAYTLIELIIYAAMGCVLSLISYSALRSAATLSVKNTNLVRSHDDLRSAYDRLARNLLSANNVPTLVSATGATVPITDTTYAAGISYDRAIGGTYILSPWPGAGNVTATQTSLNVLRSADSLAYREPPKAGDIFIIPSATGNLRATVTTCISNGITNNVEALTCGISAPLGQAIYWVADAPITAKLIRPEAFIVIGNELRYYPDFEPIPSLSDTNAYRLMTDQVSTQSGEQTPFCVKNFNGDRILTSTLQIRERPNASWIADEEQNSYNTYFQLHVNLPSRLRPRTN
jgi:hypothetical protein